MQFLLKCQFNAIFFYPFKIDDTNIEINVRDVRESSVFTYL